MTEPGFTASSLDPNRAFGGNVTFTIDSQNGKYIAPYAGDFARQQEVLFDKNSRFEVLARDVDPHTGKTQILLHEVPR